ncbi:squalene-hopene cyclase [Frankia torreyi]|uniref:Squalene-hopene cyclase n=1 Tax=Frankia torreyi TaxID=1856 RepID=A0A0D8B8K5_9ACTN|nr:squalene--hopene cyclase [Frankia torreyi]KJE20531.1 squalene-hopene cyclase [Frankia torreyi]
MPDLELRDVDRADGTHPAPDPGRTDTLSQDAADGLRETVQRAAEHLLSLQDPHGWWKFDLETNPTMDAEDLLLREYLGIRTVEQTEATAKHIRSRRLDDGSWPTYFGGPGELSTTVECYIALRLAGDPADDEPLRRSAAWIRERGGIPATRVFTRIWLALFGWWRWEDLPVLPPEIMFLPPRAPLSIYSFASWARQTIVPLTIVSALRPRRPAPFDLAELGADEVPDAQSPDTAQSPAARPPAGGRTLRDAVRRLGADRPNTAKVFFRGLDATLHRYHRHPVGPLRRHALRTAERWIIARQEADGCFGGIQPPAVYSIIALRLLGYDLDHPVLAAALRSLDAYTLHREDGSRMVEASQSPIWDTALAVLALADAGIDAPADVDMTPALPTQRVATGAPGQPATVPTALERAADWLLGQEVQHRRGDWAVAHPTVAPGGWAFEFDNDTYPDTDDTAEVVLALHRLNRLRRLRHPAGTRVDAALERSTTWLFALQSRDGGWGAYDSDNASTLVYQIPFADFGALTDPSSADVTAHVVELLCETGRIRDPRTLRGVDWLLRNQEADGSWYGRWGVNYVYGTGSVLPALQAAGLPPTHPAMRAGAQWLLSRQNPDGGWGEDIRSYGDPAWSGRGISTPSQTAWAMLGLLAADHGGTHGNASAHSSASAHGSASAHADALAGAARWLTEQQRPDGGWDEEMFTGTGFPGFFYLNYHGYRLVWPVMALGRYLHSRQHPSD